MNIYEMKQWHGTQMEINWVNEMIQSFVRTMKWMNSIHADGKLMNIYEMNQWHVSIVRTYNHINEVNEYPLNADGNQLGQWNEPIVRSYNEMNEFNTSWWDTYEHLWNEPMTCINRSNVQWHKWSQWKSIERIWKSIWSMKWTYRSFVQWNEWIQYKLMGNLWTYTKWINGMYQSFERPMT